MQIVAFFQKSSLTIQIQHHHFFFGKFNQKSSWHLLVKHIKKLITFLEINLRICMDIRIELLLTFKNMFWFYFTCSSSVLQIKQFK